MVLAGEIKVQTTVTLEYEDTTADNDLPLMANIIAAGIPGTKGYTEMRNSYKEFIPGVKKTHHKPVAPKLSERLDDAAWIARDVMKGIRKGDMKAIKDVGLEASNVAKDMRENAGETLKNLGRTGTMRGHDTNKGIGKPGGGTLKNIGRTASKRCAGFYRDSGASNAAE